VALPILYSFRRCPYAMRARMALAVAEVTVELREVSLKAKPAPMIAASPKGTVPVLILPDGRVIDESLDIVRWALGQNDPEGWLYDEDAADPFIATNDGPFKHHLDRTKYPHRTPEADYEAHCAAALIMLEPLEAILAKSAYLNGAQRSIADIALFPFIRQFAAIEALDFQALPFPQIQRWLAIFIVSPVFATVMARHPVWSSGQAPVLFP
jgi:glutathione S-transferase